MGTLVCGFVNLISRNFYSFSDVGSFSPVLRNVHFGVITAADNRRKYCTTEISLPKDKSPLNKSTIDKIPFIKYDTGLYRAFVRSNSESLFRSGLNANEVDKKLRSQWNVMSVAGKREYTKLARKISGVLRSQRANDFEVFTKENYASFALPGMKSSEVSPLLSRKWKSMSVADKEKYRKLAVKQSAAIRKKFLDSVYEMPLLELSDATIRKLKLWLNFPTQPHNAFSTFIVSSLDNKKFSGGLGGLHAAMRALGTQWNSFSDSDKQVYIDKCNKLLVEYEINVQEWQSTMINKGRPYDKLADLILESSKHVEEVDVYQ